MFTCCFCGQRVLAKTRLHQHQRNHCTNCLWSKHLDQSVGDRQAKCGGCMEPIGLTFKNEGLDKYGKARAGELMIIHYCSKCGKISLNRIASDDDEQEILDILAKSASLDQTMIDQLEQSQIAVIKNSQLEEVKTLLFGKT
ncbi:MAG: RNHCP domain-containing protein [Patescibacteria group bacterium]|nr:RNHCP domain-containing protein [Patescibacteria group bacterium]